MAFTPVESSVGGLLIGTAAALSLLVDGKIAGISGILGPFLRAFVVGGVSESLWRALFLLGLLLGGLANWAFNAAAAFPDALDFSLWRYLVAGLAVGVGTRLGNGCTSGHGICGLARLSKRSWVAVPSFMTVAGATVAATRHGLKADVTEKPWGVAELTWPPAWRFPLACVGVAAVLVLAVVLLERTRRLLSPLAAGIIFGLGLGCSGMTSQAKVLDFLDLAGQWDPSLALVMGFGLCVSFPAYLWAAKEGACPLDSQAAFELPKNSSIDVPLLVGAALFGLGWGLTGTCPGPAITSVVPYVARGMGPGLYFALQLFVLCEGWLFTDRLLAHASAAPSKPKQAQWEDHQALMAEA